MPSTALPASPRSLPLLIGRLTSSCPTLSHNQTNGQHSTFAPPLATPRKRHIYEKQLNTSTVAGDAVYTPVQVNSFLALLSLVADFSAFFRDLLLPRRAAHGKFRGTKIPLPLNSSVEGGKSWCVAVVGFGVCFCFGHKPVGCWVAAADEEKVLIDPINCSDH